MRDQAIADRERGWITRPLGKVDEQNLVGDVGINPAFLWRPEPVLVRLEVGKPCRRFLDCELLAKRPYSRGRSPTRVLRVV